MQPQSNTTPTVSRARRWRYHSAVQAAQMLNALADTGDGRHRATRADERPPRTGASRGRHAEKHTPGTARLAPTTH